MPSGAACSIALVGETEHDVREVMIEGVSGLLRSLAASRAAGVDRRRAGGWNGRTARSATPFPPRIPSSCAGRNSTPPGATSSPSGATPSDAFDMLQFGLRLGQRPRQLITTTPRPIRADQAPGRRSAHGGDARVDARQCRASVAGVPRRGGRALCRHAARPPGDRRRDHRGPRRRAVDARADRSAPALQPRRRSCASSSGSIRRRRRAPGADACGIVAAGMRRGRRIYVLADATVAGLAPAGWAAKAVALYRRLKADALVAEVNQGGDMVRAVLRAGRRGVPVRTVHATRGKWLRAEPVAALYAAGQGQARRSADAGARGRDVRLRPRAGFRPGARPTGSTRWSGR